MTPEEKKLQTETITDSVAKAVLPVMDEKIATLKEEIEESTKNLATKEDVVAAVGSKMVTKSEKLSEAKGNFTKMLKAFRDNDVESIKAMNTTVPAEG
jgi:molybdopterin converting factor small subunit